MTEPSKELLLYQRLYISAEDFQFANDFARYLLKKGWHFEPWERRRTIYLQQAAFTSAFITAYGRPFTHSKGWPAFPMSLVTYTEEQNKLHKHLIGLRHQVYAHSDSCSHDIRPMRIVGHPSAIVGSPSLKLTKEQLEQAIVMIDNLLISVRNELESIMLILN